MISDNLKLYYSVDKLLEEIELESLLQNNAKNSLSDHKTSIWLENDIYYGEISFNLQIKYDKDMNPYTAANIKLILNNFSLEGNIDKEGPKINLFTNKFNIVSSLLDFNICNECFINDNNIYGIITLNKL